MNKFDCKACGYHYESEWSRTDPCKELPLENSGTLIPVTIYIQGHSLLKADNNSFYDVKVTLKGCPICNTVKFEELQ